MQERFILITGATNGIGLETARVLARDGYSLILTCRDEFKGNQVLEALVETSGNQRIAMLPLDLASFESIREFTDRVFKNYDHIDVLLNNAGVFCDSPQKTKEGFEMTMGVNYIGHYYLTQGLLPLLKKGKAPRVVNVVSKAGFFGKITIHKDFMKRHPHGFRAYSASKLAQIYMTLYLSETLLSEGITVNAVHPGEVATGIWKGDSLMMKMMKPFVSRTYTKPDIACQTSVYVATSDTLNGVTGNLYEKNNQLIPYNKRILDKDMRNALMSYTENLIPVDSPSI